MPTYEYECKSCGHTFEIFQNMSDDPPKDCPQCGKELRRLINGGGGVIYKGSGFYASDKKREAIRNSMKPGDGETGGGGDSSTTGSTESKAAG